LLTRLISAVRHRVSNASVRMVSPKAVTSFSRLLSRGEARTAPSSLDVKGARSIVVVREDTIGDLVLMSPFLRELRRSNPSAWITLVVDAKFRNLMELCPHVNEVLGFDLSYRGRTIVPSLVFRSLRLSRRHLRPRRFDLALVPRWDVDLYHSAYIARFSGAPCRIAYSENVVAQKQEMNRDFDLLFTRTLDDRGCKHEVERNLDFLRAAGGSVTNDGLELWLSEEDRAAAQQALLSRGIGRDDLLICLALGAGEPKRIWPVERFVELARKMQREYRARIVAVGGAEDRDRGSRVAMELGLGAINLAGCLTLRQTAALFECVPLVIANDSGPMHLAAAAGAAVLEISCHSSSGDPSHRNSPARFHPWTKEYAVVRPFTQAEPCSGDCEWRDAHCILGVSVEMAQQAAKGLLASRQMEKATRSGVQSAT
jgi:ADP-heptose:LPS heptosyltransferase